MNPIDSWFLIHKLFQRGCLLDPVMNLDKTKLHPGTILYEKASGFPVLFILRKGI